SGRESKLIAIAEDSVFENPRSRGFLNFEIRVFAWETRRWEEDDGNWPPIPVTDNCFSNIGDGGRIPMDKREVLMMWGDISYLGFWPSEPSDDNGESDANQSLAKFNIEEFLNLANKVVDGDYASMDALKNCRQEVVAPVMRQQPWKTLVPMSMTGKTHGRNTYPAGKEAEYGDKQQVPAGCFQTVPTKGRIDGPAARLLFNLSDQRRRCVDDDNQVEFHVDECAEVAHVSGDVEADMASSGKDEVDCVGSNNAINAAAQLEKRVHDVDKVHEMAYK
ncbi:UNVERIFIED_CONTAM: hypothetical protein Sindi_0921300, partial [Sesamum indicum]